MPWTKKMTSRKELDEQVGKVQRNNNRQFSTGEQRRRSVTNCTGAMKHGTEQEDATRRRRNSKTKSRTKLNQIEDDGRVFRSANEVEKGPTTPFELYESERRDNF